MEPIGNIKPILIHNVITAFSGNPIFCMESLKELEPGEFVTQIGSYGKNGKETSSNRIFKTRYPLKYQGTVHIIDEVWAAFKLYNKEFEPPSNKTIHLIFKIIKDKELIIPDYKRLRPIIYPQKFIKMKTETTFNSSDLTTGICTCCDEESNEIIIDNGQCVDCYMMNEFYEETMKDL